MTREAARKELARALLRASEPPRPFQRTEARVRFLEILEVARQLEPECGLYAAPVEEALPSRS